MGNKVSLKIVLDHDDCSAVRTGSFVAGRLEMIVREKALEEMVTIDLVIQEQTFVRSGLREGRANRTLGHKVQQLEHYIRGSSDQGQLIPIHGSGTIRPGVYYLPFSFEILPKYPQSMAVERKSEYFKITYKLVAKIGEKLKVERPLTVFSSPILTSTTTITKTFGPTLRKVGTNTSWLSTGSIAMAIKIKNARLGKDSLLECYVACRNLSYDKITDVRVTLIEGYKWITDEQPLVFAALDFEQGKWLSASGAGHLPGVDLDPCTGKAFYGESLDDAMTRELETRLTNEDNMVQLKVPASALDTYDTGHLIKVSHRVRLECQVRHGVKPSIDVPVQIGETAESVKQKIQASRQDSIFALAAEAAAAAEAASKPAPAFPQLPLSQFAAMEVQAWQQGVPKPDDTIDAIGSSGETSSPAKRASGGLRDLTISFTGSLTSSSTTGSASGGGVGGVNVAGGGGSATPPTATTPQKQQPTSDQKPAGSPVPFSPTSPEKKPAPAPAPASPPVTVTKTVISLYDDDPEPDAAAAAAAAPQRSEAVKAELEAQRVAALARQEQQNKIKVAAAKSAAAAAAAKPAPPPKPKPEPVPMVDDDAGVDPPDPCPFVDHEEYPWEEEEEEDEEEDLVDAPDAAAPTEKVPLANGEISEDDDGEGRAVDIVPVTNKQSSVRDDDDDDKTPTTTNVSLHDELTIQEVKPAAAADGSTKKPVPVDDDDHSESTEQRSNIEQAAPVKSRGDGVSGDTPEEPPALPLDDSMDDDDEQAPPPSELEDVPIDAAAPPEPPLEDVPMSDDDDDEASARSKPPEPPMEDVPMDDDDNENAALPPEPTEKDNASDDDEPPVPPHNDDDEDRPVPPDDNDEGAVKEQHRAAKDEDQAPVAAESKEVSGSEIDSKAGATANGYDTPKKAGAAAPVADDDDDDDDMDFPSPAPPDDPEEYASSSATAAAGASNNSGATASKPKKVTRIYC